MRGLSRRITVAAVAMLAAAVLARTAATAAPPVAGAIFTTDSSCTGVDLNIYSSKFDVYIDGGPNHHAGAAGLPDGYYYVQVTDPSGHTVLGTSVGAGTGPAGHPDQPVHVTNGSFDQCYQLCAILVCVNNCGDGCGYGDTPNPGGVYKVWVSNDATFKNDSTKTDNFKVKSANTVTCSILCPSDLEVCNDPGRAYATVTAAQLGTPTLSADSDASCSIQSATPDLQPAGGPWQIPIGDPTVVTWSVTLGDGSVQNCEQLITVIVGCNGSGCTLTCNTSGPFCTDNGLTTYTLQAGDLVAPSVTDSPGGACTATGGPVLVNITDSGANVVVTGPTYAGSALGPGTYTANWIIVDAVGVPNFAACPFTINQAPIVSVDSVPICAGSSATLTANVSGGTFTNLGYKWSTGDTTASITVSPTSTTQYSVTVTDNNTGCTGTASATVTVNPLPICTIQADAGLTTLCAPSGTGYTYTWSGLGTGTGQCTSITGPGTYTVTVTDTSHSTNCQSTCSFCISLGAGGGLTLGFWSNNNGEKLMTGSVNGTTLLPAVQSLLRGLNLRNANGTYLYTGTTTAPTTQTITYTQFRNWILSASATNMANMLSAQLAAMELNVYFGFVNPSALIFNACTSSFVTVSSVMSAAVTSLGTDGYTVAAGATRTYQECLKTTLDRANNNLNFGFGSPGACP